MSEKNYARLKKVFKALVIMVVVLLGIVVVAFGLLVGFCALAGRH
jgi:hypothetical protein